MSKVEFLQMVPALLFGISLAEMALFLGRASKGDRKLYWEHLVLIVIAFEVIVFNWYIFYDRIGIIEASYLNFVAQLFSPLASLIYVANLLVKNNTPDEPVQNYFNRYRKRIFLSLSLFLTVNLVTVLYFNPNIHVGFIPVIPLTVVLINAFYDLKWLRILAYAVKLVQVVAFCIYFK
ncbi:MAG: hypothetical protein ACJ75J_17380 [Cytophagaceae bacterium]